MQGNRKLAAVMAAILGVVGTAALTVVGVPVEIASLGISLIAALGGVRAIQSE